MSANATSTASSSEASKPPFAGDDFVNNLYTDLAPLLALFGEQVTKQFLSMSMGWADHILFGCGPIGILTAVVSAIRVGGERHLKALIGRARESKLTAEQELLSSTSNEVCELWNAREIVRLIGSPYIQEMVLYTKDDRLRVMQFYEAVSEGYWESRHQNRPMPTSPNLGLNIGRGVSRCEAWFFAAVGIVLQTVAVVLPGFFAYEWQWHKGDGPVPQFAYPCFVIGTVMITSGVALCSYAVDVATEEIDFSPSKEHDLVVHRTFRIQVGCVIGDQKFSTYYMPNEIGNQTIKTSRIMNEDRNPAEAWSVWATSLTITGFIIQFVGLRALHWSATIIQLGITLFLTAARARMRRSLMRSPQAFEFRDKTHVSIMVGAECMRDRLQQPIFQTSRPQDDQNVSTAGWGDPQDEYEWTIPYANFGQWEEYVPQYHLGRVRYDLRVQIRKSLSNPSDDLEVWPIARRLKSAIEVTMALWQACADESFMESAAATEPPKLRWLLPIVTKTKCNDICSREVFTLRLECTMDGSGWHFSVDELDLWSMLRLMLDSVHEEDRADCNPGTRFLRVIGSWTRFSTFHLAGLPSWIGEPVLVCPMKYGKNVDDTESSSTSSRLFSQESKRNRTDFGVLQSELSKRRIRKHPVFGYSLDAHKRRVTLLGLTHFKLNVLFPNRRRTPPKESYDDVTSTMRLLPRYQFLEACLPEACEPCLFYSSSLPLITQYALDIFGTFAEELAVSTKRLVTKSLNSYPEGRLPRCNVLRAVAELLVSENLVDCIEEANAVVVPPFVRHDLLAIRPEMEPGLEYV